MYRYVLYIYIYCALFYNTEIYFIRLLYRNPFPLKILTVLPVLNCGHQTITSARWKRFWKNTVQNKKYKNNRVSTLQIYWYMYMSYCFRI